MALFTKNFIESGFGMSEYFDLVPAPMFRKAFYVDGVPVSAKLKLTGLGYYRAFVNGVEITRGLLSPYTSNIDHLVYFDDYDIAPYLRSGENVLAVTVGNGMRNCLGGRNWRLNKARFRGAPIMACVCTITDGAGDVTTFEADESFRTHKSPILYDDLRIGEVYDARLEAETEGWMLPGYDDSAWSCAVMAEMPRGEQRVSISPPIKPRGVLTPVKIWEEEGTFVYDFGQNGAGLITLHTDAEAGRRIVVEFAEYLMDGRFYNDTIMSIGENSGLPHRAQTADYTSKGGTQVYTPSFCYEGFRYAKVHGITKEEATPERLTFTLMNTELHERGSFHCSDPVLNELQRITREASLSNMHHIPTDCPHREKNGWTADAALSMVHLLLNLDIDDMFTEWMRSVAANMNDKGALTGLIPAADWGYDSWNGPAWDAVLFEVPFRLWQYRDDRRAMKIAAPAMFRYVAYTLGRRDERGLVAIGLGDWCAPHDNIKSPLAFTDTVMCYDVSRKAAAMYDELGSPELATFCRGAAEGYLCALREHMIDHKRAVAAGDCQTSQAMAIYYGIFEKHEIPQAVRELKRQIKETDGHLDTGVLGVRVLFRVLAEHGLMDLAYEMMIRPDAPSYGNMVARGETTLVEDFNEKGERINSRNHHFLGDISAWFIECICGIKINPGLERGLAGRESYVRVGADTVEISPNLPTALTHAEAHHDTPYGRVSVKLWRDGKTGVVNMELTAPEEMTGRVIAPAGFHFDGFGEAKLVSGEYEAFPGVKL